MAYDANNIFARILRGELPCVKIFENASVLAFMDAMPQSDGHVLVIPKEPAETLLDLSSAGAAACLEAVRYLAPAVMKAVAADGFMASQVNGRGAGQSVPHVHFHLIPRWQGVELKPHMGNLVDNETLKAIAAKIIAALGAASQLEC
ncbi:MAG: HIT family protein [Azonexus sp.]|jgi:histidine triad (HIT) family protein|nr:HIT family protein [Azonexus sp.]